MAQNAQNGRQLVKFTFYKVSNAWRLLPAQERERGKAEFCAVLDELSDRLMVRSYSLVGLRGDVDIMLWLASYTTEPLQQLATRLNATALGPYLTIPYSYLAVTRRSMYLIGHQHTGQERLKVQPRGSTYLFVYPFIKTRAWYELPQQERQAMMDEHIAIGHKYMDIKINTTYSYGIDDQEFVVAFEGDDPTRFVDLVMDLRLT
ncbi:MAG: chlorite dismutase family protein, partial [Chloroflexi bacterium]|nr:chlorite dismutase family protein [Chloroflexota bacterium]